MENDNKDLKAFTVLTCANTEHESYLTKSR